MKIALIGRSEFLYLIAQDLLQSGHSVVGLVTAKESSVHPVRAIDFEQFAEEAGIPFLLTARPSTYEDIISSWEADIAVSVNFPTILEASTIDIFPLGILNVHGGDLPKYRGNACQAWAIINGENHVALCVHKMIGGEVDTGPIIARERLAIDISTKVTKIIEWMKFVAPGLVARALQELEENPCFLLEIPSPDPAEGLRCYPRRPEDGQIDWKADAETIIRLVNAHNRPYAGAFTSLEREHLIIWDAQLEDDYENFLAIPGQVTRVGQGYITVACGNGKVRIFQVEVDGKVATPDFFVSSIRCRLGH